MYKVYKMISVKSRLESLTDRVIGCSSCYYFSSFLCCLSVGRLLLSVAAAVRQKFFYFIFWYQSFVVDSLWSQRRSICHRWACHVMHPRTASLNCDISAISTVCDSKVNRPWSRIKKISKKNFTNLKPAVNYFSLANNLHVTSPRRHLCTLCWCVCCLAWRELFFFNS